MIDIYMIYPLDVDIDCLLGNDDVIDQRLKLPRNDNR